MFPLSWPVALALSLVLTILETRWPWPFGTFNTLTHELGHCLAFILSGGEVDFFGIALKGEPRGWTLPNEGKEGCAWIVSPAGHLGSVLFFGGLLLLVNGPGWSPRLLALALGIILFVLTFAFECECFTRLNGLAVSAILIGVSFSGYDPLAAFALNVVAFQGLLSNIIVLWSLTGAPCPPPKGAHDACRMATSTSSCWATLWFLIALSILVFCLLFLVWPDYITNQLLLIWPYHWNKDP
jgi:hypothetical protein